MAPSILSLSVTLLLLLADVNAAVKDKGVACDPSADVCAHATLELVCDTTALKCLLKVGEACSVAADCTNGADCSSGTCTCGSGYTASDPVGTCVQGTSEKAGGACGTNSACTSDATCNSQSKCACDAGFKVTITDGTCAAVAAADAVNGKCTPSSSSPQGSCDDAGAECPAANPACQCAKGKSGATCATNITANDFGGSCTYSATNAQGTCTTANTVCPNGDAFCQCADNYISLDGSSCVPVAGQVGGACTADTVNTKGQCAATDAVCTGTTKGTCKISLGSACTKTADCADANAECDAFAKTCLLKTDQTCTTKQDKCVSGASCNTTLTPNQCKCIADVYTVTSNLCYAADGKATGDCKSADPKCDDANAECDATSSKCTCKTGYKLKNADATCEKSGAITVIASALTVMLVAVSGHLITLH